MLWSFVFFTSQKIHFQLDNFFFLLHYRGLSYSGFYLFKQMGLYLHPRSLKKTFENVVLCHLPPVSACNVIWFDNLYRKLRGEGKDSTNQHLTVIGCSNLPFPRPAYDGVPSIDNIFSDCYVNSLNDSIVELEENRHLDVWLPNSTLQQLESLSIPLRSKASISYDFRELDVLPLQSGTAKGLSDIIGYLKTNFKLWDNDSFTLMVVDYDIYWRLHLFMWTDSFIGCLQKFRDTTILFPGPWHIYKTLCDSIWKKFSSLLFAEVWCFTSDGACPKTPTLPEITFYFIAFWAIAKNRQRHGTTFRSSTLYGSLLQHVMTDLIPTVCTHHLLTLKY